MIGAVIGAIVGVIVLIWIVSFVFQLMVGLSLVVGVGMKNMFEKLRR